MPVSVAYIIGLILAIGGTVAALIFITPEKKKAGLHPVLQFFHDLFNFKFLVLEMILKVLYILSTLFCVFGGFFMLFSGVKVYNWYGESHFQSFALTGIVTMILGPIIVRLIFEASMLFILLVKNTIQINKKLRSDDPEANVDPLGAASISIPKAPAATCRYCGAKLKNGQKFCPQCGQPQDGAQQ